MSGGQKWTALQVSEEWWLMEDDEQRAVCESEYVARQCAHALNRFWVPREVFGEEPPADWFKDPRKP